MVAVPAQTRRSHCAAFGHPGCIEKDDLVKRARQAQAALAAGTEDKAFYEAKIATARYFADRFVPDAGALRRKIESGSESMMALGEEAFATAS